MTNYGRFEVSSIELAERMNAYDDRELCETIAESDDYYSVMEECREACYRADLIESWVDEEDFEAVLREAFEALECADLINF